MIYVCTPDAGNCCCGRSEKGNPTIDWEDWRAAHAGHPVSRIMRLVPTKCLGPCEAANVALLRVERRSHWFGEMGRGDVEGFLDYAFRVATGVAHPADDEIQTHLFEPEIPVTTALTDDAAACVQVDELVRTYLDDAAAGWSCGSFGAVAEFSRDEREPTIAVASGVIATERGAIAVSQTARVRPIAYEAPSSDPGFWQHGIALALPRDACTMSGRRVVTELGPDANAVRAEDRTAILFDLGLDVLQIDACVRTDDPGTLAALRASEGRSLSDAGNPLGAILPKLGPHRVFISRIGRIEVYGAIPPPDGKSPDGPHTHVLPKLLARERTHAANLPIDDGWVPCMTIFPPSPMRDRMGEPKPFDAREYAAFAADWERFALPELVARKALVTDAVRRGARVPEPTTRFERIATQVTMRQLAQLASIA